MVPITESRILGNFVFRLALLAFRVGGVFDAYFPKSILKISENKFI